MSSSLYCEDHGKEIEQLIVNEQNELSTTIAFGTLLYDEYRCDQCNCPLRKGDFVYLIKTTIPPYSDSKDDYGLVDIKKKKTINPKGY